MAEFKQGDEQNTNVKEQIRGTCSNADYLFTLKIIYM